MNKQIEEMAYEIETRLGYLKSTCYNAANILYHAGYRKQSEVAKNIFDAIKEKLIFNTYGIATISNKTFCELKKKYESEGADDDS